MRPSEHPVFEEWPAPPAKAAKGDAAAPVPEPGAAVLFGAALVVLAVYGRSRRR